MFAKAVHTDMKIYKAASHLYEYKFTVYPLYIILLSRKSSYSQVQLPSTRLSSISSIPMDRYGINKPLTHVYAE